MMRSVYKEGRADMLLYPTTLMPISVTVCNRSAREDNSNRKETLRKI